jgi:hypothetical protein
VSIFGAVPSQNPQSIRLYGGKGSGQDRIHRIHLWCGESSGQDRTHRIHLAVDKTESPASIFGAVPSQNPQRIQAVDKTESTAFIFGAVKAVDKTESTEPSLVLWRQWTGENPQRVHLAVDKTESPASIFGAVKAGDNTESTASIFGSGQDRIQRIHLCRGKGSGQDRIPSTSILQWTRQNPAHPRIAFSGRYLSRPEPANLRSTAAAVLAMTDMPSI